MAMCPAHYTGTLRRVAGVGAGAREGGPPCSPCLVHGAVQLKEWDVPGEEHATLCVKDSVPVSVQGRGGGRGGGPG